MINKQPQIFFRCVFVSTLILLLGRFLFAATPTPPPTAIPTAQPSGNATTTVSSAGENSKDACLGCHGPYDKLVSANANYSGWEGGETTSPHRYVPHDSKDIPECSNCHKPHPVLLTSMEGLPQPNGTWCYGCHHKRVLKCGTCH